MPAPGGIEIPAGLGQRPGMSSDLRTTYAHRHQEAPSRSPVRGIRLVTRIDPVVGSPLGPRIGQSLQHLSGVHGGDRLGADADLLDLRLLLRLRRVQPLRLERAPAKASGHGVGQRPGMSHEGLRPRCYVMPRGQRPGMSPERDECRCQPASAPVASATTAASCGRAYSAPGMTMRDSSLRAAAVLAVCAAALLVAGCGGGGKGGAKVLGGSNNTSVCQYTKRFGRGRVYVEIAVSPVSLEPTACSAFNRIFRGRSFGRNAPSLPAGTGRPQCDFNKIGSSYRIEVGVFASRHTGIGRAFCRSFHPGHGFTRVSLPG